MPAARVYLDHNASAPLRPEAKAAMLSALELTGNAASVHAEGRRARALIEEARADVARLVGAKPGEIVFTSGATEANNWVLRAGWASITTSSIEHDSVLAPARASRTAIVEWGSRADGVIAARDREAHPSDTPVTPASTGEVPRPAAAGRPGPGGGGAGSPPLLSLQLANSETGVIQPIRELAGTVAGTGTVLHTDAVQAVGRIPVDFAALGVDLMSISAHKIGGPQGIGALVIRNGIELAPLVSGGGHQLGRRSGTESTAAIAGFGAAAAAARDGLADMPRIAALRDRLEHAVREVTPAAVVIARDAPRLPNTSCIALAGAEAATLLIKLDLAGIAISAGSACSSGRIAQSHVLTAMDVPTPLARSAIRVSLGYTTTAADIDRFIAAWSHIHRATGDRIHPTHQPISAPASSAQASRAAGA